ncbi:TPA: PapI protein [Escherichia coli]|nr:PapI protein [Escherichia coli]HAM7630260.1 PapI protein [Escherichia coli]
MLPSETMIWQPEFTDKTLSRKPGAVQKHAGVIFLYVNKTGAYYHEEDR